MPLRRWPSRATARLRRRRHRRCLRTRRRRCSRGAEPRTRQERGGCRFDHAGHVRKGTALAPNFSGRCTAWKAVIDEFLPPGGQLAGGNIRELRAGLGNGDVTRRELAHGVGKLVLLFGNCQGIVTQASRPRIRAALPYRNFGHTSSLNGTPGISRKMRSSDKPHREVPRVQHLVGAA